MGRGRIRIKIKIKRGENAQVVDFQDNGGRFLGIFKILSEYLTWTGRLIKLMKFFVCLMARHSGQRGTQKFRETGWGLTVPAASGTLGGSSPTANPVGVNIRGKGDFSPHLRNRAFFSGPVLYIRRGRRSGQ
jgi:hypothetical protein